MKLYTLFLLSSLLVGMENKEHIQIDIEEGKVVITDVVQPHNNPPSSCWSKKKLIALAASASVVVSGAITLGVHLSQKG